MIVVADKKITEAAYFFGELGDLVRVEAGEITPSLVRDADVLLVRSVTSVDADLVEGSRVSFVGTATAGQDHIDAKALSDRGIGFAASPGANAGAVCEYVLAVLAHHLASDPDRGTQDRRIGVVGYGNIGRPLTAAMRGLGLAVDVCDPPLAAARACRPEGGSQGFFGLDELFRRCDVVTLHVPLIREGPHPTVHLVDAKALSDWDKDDALLINTSRGAVVDHDSLLGSTSLEVSTVLDVWEGEPDRIRWQLLDAPSPDIALATPHIAGYSFDAKVEATRRLRAAYDRHTGRAAPGRVVPKRPEPAPLMIDCAGCGAWEVLARCFAAACPLGDADAGMRAAARLPAPEREEAFRQLRPARPSRRGFVRQRVRLDNLTSEAQRQSLTRKLRWVGLDPHDNRG